MIEQSKQQMKYEGPSREEDAGPGLSVRSRSAEHASQQRLAVEWTTGGGLTLQRTPVRIDTLLSAAWEKLKPAAVRKQIGVCIYARRNTHRDATVFSCDAERIQRVLLSLIGSAIEVSPVGSQLFVKSWSTADEVCVSVRDAEPSTQHGNLGSLVPPLGSERRRQYSLQNLQSEMLEHGGRLSIQAAPGAGTSVTLLLPRWLDRDASPPRPH